MAIDDLRPERHAASGLRTKAKILGKLGFAVGRTITAALAARFALFAK
jgi:hypothetical protein